ncbi:MAG: FlxA-like family protein [Ignavibacteriaceae bacterium]
MKSVLSFTFILATILSGSAFAQQFDFFEPTTTIGGYGELHYNNDKVENEDYKSTLDFHRFVIFLGHNWTEKFSFRAELELEHNFVEEGQGELELEQAFVNYHHSNYLGVQAGVLLVGAGLINEYHEPPRFLSVERPVYHNLIIPTTWFGNGAAVYGSTEGMEYRFTLMEGLNSDKISSSSAIRSARQKGFKADAENFLYNFKLDYTNLPGFRIGGSFTYNNANGDSTNIAVSLAEFHAQYQAHNIYGVFEFGNISYSNGDLKASRGFYADLGYDVGSLICDNQKLIPFVRYSDINTSADTESGGVSEDVFHFTEILFGISYLPIDNVAIKIDYNQRDYKGGGITTNSLNLGVGYMF